MKYYVVVWNDFEAGTECYLYARRNLAEEFAMNSVITTYDEIDMIEWGDERPFPCFARMKNRFEMFIQEVELLKN